MTSAALPAAALPADWNRHAFLDVNQFARDTSWLHGVMEWFAKDGVVLLAIALVVAWWIARRRRSPHQVAVAVWGALGALVALAIAQPISSAVDERRPFVAIPKALLLIRHSSDPGFPSDHATAAGAVACAVFLVSWQLGAITTLVALLIAFSRVYVGVHYPQDVLGGLALGAAVVALGYFVIVPLLARIAEWLATTWLRPLISAPTASEAAHDSQP
ncbi:MAG TPA: phosphatase PAP2 family protein [Mycobacteriales bacterium]|nr:phosphatase PAP2 family protein [Mycobacteriales bacterium]